MHFLVSLFFHSLTFFALALTIYYDCYHTVAPLDSREHVVRTTLAGRFKFLTFINAVSELIDFIDHDHFKLDLKASPRFEFSA